MGKKRVGGELTPKSTPPPTETVPTPEDTIKPPINHTNEVNDNTKTIEPQPTTNINQIAEDTTTVTHGPTDKVPEIETKTFKDIDIQVGESFTDNKVNCIHEKRSTKPFTNSKDPSTRECLKVLVKTFIAVLRLNSERLIHLIAMVAFVLSGSEALLVITALNIIYHMYVSYPQSEEKETVQPVFDELDVPRTSQVKLRRKLNKLENNRKKSHLREETSSSGEELENEEQVYLSNPKNIGPTTKFTLIGLVHETPISFEIDSGSAVSILSSEAYNQIDPRHILKEEETTKVCTDFNGRDITFKSLVISSELV